EKLEELLEKKFGNNLLKDTVNNVHVLVPAYNITDKKTTYFTNKNFRDYLMKDVIRASTTAPAYFSAKQIDNKYYIDGVCSLGMGSFQMELSNLKDSGGIVWAIPLIFLMMNISSKIVEENLDDCDKKDQYYHLESELLEDIPLDNIHEKSLKNLRK
ncbi:22551_t:CDS:2, partial [Gigaspora margarita]